MNSTALAIVSAQIIQSLSFCDMPVVVVDKFANGAMARTDGVTMAISTEIRPSEIEWAVTHECVHQLHWNHLDNKDLYMFGRKPYVTEYASESFDEDIAETLTAVYLGHVVRGRKGAVARKIIRQLAIPPM